MFCTNCGNKISNADKFCPKCGRDLKSLEDTTKCPKCDADRNAGSFCTKCGFKYQYKPTSSQDVQISKPKNNTVFNVSLLVSIVVGITIVFLAVYYS
jgi:uncharacterized membrane protein YvbJ